MQKPYFIPGDKVVVVNDYANSGGFKNGEVFTIETVKVENYAVFVKLVETPTKYNYCATRFNLADENGNSVEDQCEVLKTCSDMRQ